MSYMFILNIRVNSVFFNLLNYGQDSYIAFKDRIKYVIETIYNGKMVKLDTPTNPVQIDEMAFKRG